jgi:uncharacterized membrane protein YqaE (UPF0057 family)
LYFLAILLPPLAVLLCGKPFSAVVNLVLTCFYWAPGAIHAVLVVNSHKNDKRFTKLEKTIIAASKVKTETPSPVKTITPLTTTKMKSYKGNQIKD